MHTWCVHVCAGSRPLRTYVQCMHVLMYAGCAGMLGASSCEGHAHMPIHICIYMYTGALWRAFLCCLLPSGHRSTYAYLATCTMHIRCAYMCRLLSVALHAHTYIVCMYCCAGITQAQAVHTCSGHPPAWAALARLHLYIHVYMPYDMHPYAASGLHL